MSKTYQCGVCGGTFEKGWSDAEAQSEYDQIIAALRPFGKPS